MAVPRVGILSILKQEADQGDVADYVRNNQSVTEIFTLVCIQIKIMLNQDLEDSGRSAAY